MKITLATGWAHQYNGVPGFFSICLMDSPKSCFTENLSIGFNSAAIFPGVYGLHVSVYTGELYLRDVVLGKLRNK